MDNNDLNRLLTFPNVVDDKILLTQFLDASRRLANLVNDLGKLFSPLSYDMSNNIDKIITSNVEPNSQYIEDLIIYEKSTGKESVSVSLLWLKRSLHFLLIFFQSFLTNSNESDNLESIMVTAYSASLKPYHGWITRNLFLILKKACPVRSVVVQLLKNRMDDNADYIAQLNDLCISLNSNICHIDEFYQINKLNIDSCAP